MRAAMRWGVEMLGWLGQIRQFGVDDTMVVCGRFPIACALPAKTDTGCQPLQWHIVRYER